MFTTNLIEQVLRSKGSDISLKPSIISNVLIDSRKCVPGSLFLAFKGERTDGHDFIPELLKKGVFCVGERDDISGETYIKVDSVLEFLTDLAKLRRKKFKGQVFAITGSSGKTSTRQVIVSMLELSSKTVYATSGNMNNHIGLPLVILNTPMNIDSLVLEMGMNHTGEIEHLVKIADPHFSVITNIGTAHIGNFNSQDELALAKLEIFEHSQGVAIANTDDPYIKKWIEKKQGKREIIEYSINDSKVIKESFQDLSGYMSENVFTASVVVKSAVGVIPDIQKTIDNCNFPKMRGELKTVGKRTFVVDCYNANPESMRVSIGNFYKKYSESKSSEIYLILGSMFELGEFSKKMHEELVNYLKTLNLLKRVFLIGSEFDKLKLGFLNEQKVLFLGSVDDLMEHFPKEGIFLLKGSRGNRLERIFELIEINGGKS